MQHNSTRQQDETISVLLGVIHSDKIPLKSSYGTEINSIIWKTEEIDVNADNCISVQDTTTFNRPAGV